MSFYFAATSPRRAPTVAIPRATADVLAAAFIDLGLDALAEDKPAFVHVPAQLIASQRVRALPAERVVIQVLLDEPANEELAASMEELRMWGYEFAVDYRRGEGLFHAADFVKVDIRACSGDEASLIPRQLADFGARLVAEKIETQVAFQECRDAGYELFQGFFLHEPCVLCGPKSPPASLKSLQLIQLLRRPDVEIDEVEQVFRADAVLTYKLLRLSNSALYARGGEIRTIRQALLHLGLMAVADWASILLLTPSRKKPDSLMTTVLARGLMCEGLAEAAGAEDPEEYFLVGLLSLLEAVFDRPLRKLLERLPVAKNARDALLDGAGPMGAAVACVKAYERARWEQVRFLDLDHRTINEVYWKAVRRADETAARSVTTS